MLLRKAKIIEFRNMNLEFRIIYDKTIHWHADETDSLMRNADFNCFLILKTLWICELKKLNP